MARPEYWESAKLTHIMSDEQSRHWGRILEPYRDQIKEVLEVGSYEGQSALFWHHEFGANVSCVDNWQNFASGCSSAEEVEQHFDENTKVKTIYKLEGDSTLCLNWLSTNNFGFDMAYIDGD